MNNRKSIFIVSALTVAIIGVASAYAISEYKNKKKILHYLDYPMIAEGK